MATGRVSQRGPLPFVNNLQSGDEELSGASPQAINVTIDGAGAVRRRPGIARYFTGDASLPPGQVIGLHVTEAGNVFAVHIPSEGSLVQSFYRVAPGGTISLGTRVGSKRPVFAETEMLLVIANGQAVSKIELAHPVTVSSLGGSPPIASHIVNSTQKLLANDLTVDRTGIRFSDVAQGTVSYAGHEFWTAFATGHVAGFLIAEAAPDPVVAVGENTNEIWVFGSRTLQLYAYQPDTEVDYAALSTMEVGCSAPYSVVKKDDSFYWLDHLRRFVGSSGRGTDVLSKGLHKILQGFARVDDCFGYRVLLGPVDGVAWTFPSEGRTFFIQEGAGWSEWTSWNNQHLPFSVTAHAYDRLTASNLVGGVTGVARMQSGAASDITVDGTQPIVASVTTGFINRDTDARKHCKRIRLSFRREAGSSPACGQLTYRDSLGAWEPPIPVWVDGADPVCEISSLGTYRRRQWRYSFSSETEDLVLVGAEEDFEVTD